MMPEISDDKQLSKIKNRRVHFANERTFLAWIRTSIGVMAFGFVVEKFGLFVKQFSYFLAKSGVAPGTGPVSGEAAPPAPGYSAFLGISLVLMGALMALLAFIRFKKTEKQIDEDT